MPSIDEQAAQWVIRRSGGGLPEVEAEFQAWYARDPRHRGAFLRAEAAWTLLDRAQVLSHGPVSGAHADLLQLGLDHTARTRGGRGKTTASRFPSRRAVIGAAIAASVGAAIATSYGLHNRLSLLTARGELRKVPLKDHSLATINTDSQIEVDISPKLRHIGLVKGEAWFEVAKDPDAPFVVSAGDIRVRAVGTAFSVRRHETGADVLVTEGTVETWNVRDKAQRVRLIAGNTAFVSNQPIPAAVAFQPDEIARRLAWRDRRIVLDHESLAEAVAEFNRYNEVKIVVADPALARQTLVGGFAVDQPEAFARAVHVTLNAPVEIGPDQIVIGAPAASG